MSRVESTAELLMRRGRPATAVASTEMAFDGGEDVTAPLTWGQLRVAGLQAALEPTHATLNVRLAERLRPGITLDEVLRAIGRVVESCASLRTRFRTDDEPPYQDTLGRGILDVALLRAAPETAAAVADDLASLEFRPTDLPARFCVLLDDDVPHSLTIATSHLSVDYFGAAQLLWQLQDVLARTLRRPVRSATPRQPAELSAWETSEEGRRAGEQAVARHARTFDEMPVSMLPRLPRPALEPRYRYVELRSPVATRCVAYLSARHGVSESAVLYGAFGMLLAGTSGLTRSHLQVCVANRTNRSVGSAVAPLTQDVPTWLDLENATFDDVVRRAGGVLLGAATRGRFPPWRMAEEQRRAEERRGARFDLSFWLNSRLTTPFLEKDRPTAAELDRLRRESSLTQLGGDATSTSTLFTYLDRRESVLHLRVMTDTAYIAPSEAEAWLGAVEELLVLATFDEDRDLGSLTAAAGIEPDPRDADWARVDHSWIHLPTTAARLREIPGYENLVDVTTEPSAAGDRLVALLDEDASPDDAQAMHALLDSKITMLPHVARTQRGTTHAARGDDPPAGTGPVTTPREHPTERSTQ